MDTSLKKNFLLLVQNSLIFVEKFFFLFGTKNLKLRWKKKKIYFGSKKLIFHLKFNFFLVHKSGNFIEKKFFLLLQKSWIFFEKKTIIFG